MGATAAPRQTELLGRNGLGSRLRILLRTVPEGPEPEGERAGGDHDRGHTVECLSLEGRAAPVRDTGRQDVWIERYLAKYRPISADLSAEFIRRNLVVEFEPERALAVIERESEFATRATRWRFEGP